MTHCYFLSSDQDGGPSRNLKYQLNLTELVNVPRHPKTVNVVCVCDPSINYILPRL